MILNVIKRKRRIKDQVVLSNNYYVRYRFDNMSEAKLMPLGVSSKDVAWERANEFGAEYELEKGWYFASQINREAESKSISCHIEDYLADLKARGKDGRKGKGIKQIRSRLQRLTTECNWTSLGRVNADSFTQWRSRLNNMSPQTKNHYLSEAKTFLNWLILQSRIAVNPLASCLQGRSNY